MADFVLHVVVNWSDDLVTVVLVATVAAIAHAVVDAAGRDL